MLVLVLAAGLGSGYAWTRTQYFVGDSGERVAIFQGLSDDLPGISLSHVYELQPLTIAELPIYYQERVRASIDVGTLDSARQTVAELREAAQPLRRAATQPHRVSGALGNGQSDRQPRTHLPPSQSPEPTC